MHPDFPTTPLTGSAQHPVRNRYRPTLVWTVRAGTVLILLDIDDPSAHEGAWPGRCCPQPQEFRAGRSGAGLLRHEPPLQAGVAVHRAFWAAVTVAVDSGRPVVVVSRGLSPATGQARQLLVTRGGQVLARTSRAELQGRLNAQLVTVRSGALRSAQVMAITGVRSVYPSDCELRVTADPDAGVVAALRALDPHAQVWTRPLTLRDVFQGL